MKLGNFLPSDKAKVIELLLKNDNVLIFLYEKLFPAVSTNEYKTNPTSVKEYQDLHNSSFSLMT